ncbi:hypothetical protein CUC15_07205 [Oceanobacillus zhaokaii]|jgi:gas vesicle protein|uniref:YtxH domain-containing protein n=1 Tax=Oceanobacillus zhaokaii TaxID=2052660 RepID=A0A345PFD4_9BACI|nr:YtxH domain-containing protein [Oceanobacillus zhaokaii]AXI08714.1 hypothetical protein CUC15_07205 [Oceanobacillus zhaokaii]
MSKAKSFVLGLVVGGTVSAAVTLLSTPSSGRTVRDQVKIQGLELKQLLTNLKENGLQLKMQFRESSKEGAVLVKELTQDIRKSVEEWKNTVEPHQESIHKYLEQIETSIKDLEEKVKKQ